MLLATSKRSVLVVDKTHSKRMCGMSAQLNKAKNEQNNA